MIRIFASLPAEVNAVASALSDGSLSAVVGRQFDIALYLGEQWKGGAADVPGALEPAGRHRAAVKAPEPAGAAGLRGPGGAAWPGCGIRARPAGLAGRDLGKRKRFAPVPGSGAMVADMSWPALLHDALQRRPTPEQVAQILLDHRAAFRFTGSQADVLTTAAGQGRRSRLAGMLGCTCPSCMAAVKAQAAVPAPAVSYTSMPDEFERADTCAVQIAHAARMFGITDPTLYARGDPRRVDPADAEAIAGWVDGLGAPLAWQHGSDWLADRPNRGMRELLIARQGDPHPALACKRQYNRHIRVLRSVEDKRRRVAAMTGLVRLVKVGRSGFAVDIPPGRVEGDRHAAAFCAYYAARRNLRREFTTADRDNPFDACADMLLTRCGRRPGTDWTMIAAVCPRPQVLAHLDDRAAGALLGRWWAVMSEAAEILAGIWPGEGRWQDGKVSRREMIVARGIDSSTWNTCAAAYNRARDGWLNLACARGMTELTEAFLPGKVMRVMARDLARWHMASGGDVHPDTKVWAALPLPWDVIHGLADCDRATVEGACRMFGVDPVASGWTGPRAAGALADWRPTPELVHGVAIANPVWAGLLRKAGVFSGKSAEVTRALEAAVLRARAEAEGQVTGPLPVYDQAGAYHGTTHGGAGGLPLLGVRSRPSRDRARQLNAPGQWKGFLSGFLDPWPGRRNPGVVPAHAGVARPVSAS